MYAPWEVHVLETHDEDLAIQLELDLDLPVYYKP